MSERFIKTILIIDISLNIRFTFFIIELKLLKFNCVISAILILIKLLLNFN